MRGALLLAAVGMLGLSSGGLAQTPAAQPPVQVKVPSWEPGIPKAPKPQPATQSSSQMAKIPTGAGRCGQLAAIINSDGPTGGALASQEHAVAVLKAGIERIDLACEGAAPELRATYFNVWQQVRANCLQLTSGAATYADLPDSSSCKEEVRPR